MSRLYLFNPENDLALAGNTTNYTAPPAAMRLRRAGATLPLWYGSEGDFAITDGVNARWLSEVRSRFGIEVGLYEAYTEGMEPVPWGWSANARHIFELRGVPRYVMPSDSSLDRMREISHRRSSAIIASALREVIPDGLSPVAVEPDSYEEIVRYARENGEIVVKLPWSSSGRGVIPLKAGDLDRQRQQLEGAIRRQGSVMAEPRYAKKLDFAALYEMNGGKCHFEGLSVFETSGFSAYEGNILASVETLHDMICESLGGSGLFDDVLSALPAIIEDYIGDAYSGPLGIDMMSVDAEGYSLVPVVELNLRMTMGHVCHRFYRDHVAPGKRGRFSVLPAVKSGMMDCTTKDCRMIQGVVDLAQPGSDFSFIVQV